jgi:putative membrane protein
MRFAALALVTLIATLHFYITWFDIFAWEVRGPKMFSSFDPELFSKTINLAANEGIYNAFLATGLTWSLFIKGRYWQKNVAVCFLVFVFIAGVFGAATVTFRTFFIQSVPALLAIVLMLLGTKAPQTASTDT